MGDLSLYSVRKLPGCFFLKKMEKKNRLFQREISNFQPGRATKAHLKKIGFFSVFGHILAPKNALHTVFIVELRRGAQGESICTINCIQGSKIYFFIHK